MTTAHDFEFHSIDGGALPLSKFKGKAILVVNLGHPAPDAYFPRQPRLGHDAVIDWA